MLPTRIRPVGAALLAAACLLLPGVGRPADPPKAPPPRPVPVATELEALLVGRSPDEVLAVLNQLAQEWTARKGGYEVAHHRVTGWADALIKARQRLAGLTPYTGAGPLVLRADDVEPAIKAAQVRANYAHSRVAHLESIKTVLETIGFVAADFDRAAADADGHLFKMKIAAGLAKGVPGDTLPPALAANAMADAATKLKAVGTDVTTGADKAKADLIPLEKELAGAKVAAEAATAKVNELKAARESTLAAFAFEEQVKAMNAEQLPDEFTRLRKLLAEKTAAIRGDADDYAKANPAVTDARAKRDAVKEPPVPGEASAATGLEAAGRTLFAAQQYLAARVRAGGERAEKATALVAALDELEKKAVAYSTTLDDARRMAGQLAAVAAEVARRVGRGDLDTAKVPEGLAEAAGTTGGRAKLDADAAAVQATLADLRAERDALRKPDTETENLKALTATLLARVNERIDLHTDLKKLATDSTTARKDRPDTAQKRMDQRATERMAAEAGRWDRFFALDHSKPATDIAVLLDAYYKELVDLDEKGENLKLQKEALEKLVDLTRKEAEDIAKLRTLLERRLAQSEVWQWDNWLAWRLDPAGLKAEAGIYHDEAARLTAAGGATARRVQALAGTDQTKQPATGGEIGQARGELFEARARGLAATGIKIGVVLLAALVIPRMLMSVLRRAIRGGTDAAGNPSPVLSALRGVLKTGVWIAAVALILSVLGYDVTALVVGLAIGVLAIALAARPMIADVLGSVVIFAERRFQVGDVVRLGGGDPARVVGLTWRSTALKNTSGLVVSVPNRKVTEVTVENLSRGTETYDSLAVAISTDKDAGRVIGVIRGALAQCKNLSPDQGVTVLKFTQKGIVKVVEYRFWWFLKDYEARNKTRDEVFTRIAVGLANEDMTGIEIALA